MNDLLTVFHIARKHKFKLLALFFLIWFLFYLSGGEELIFVSISPDKGYRVEHYIPRRYQLLLHSTMDEPGFVRLYNNHSNRYFGESQVVDFSADDAAPIWNMDANGHVAVGHSIYYENVPPLDSSGRELSIPPFSQRENRR